MAENEERRPGSGREATPSGDRLDQTRAVEPLADDQAEGRQAQRTAPGDTARHPVADDTSRLGGAGDTARFPAGGGGDEATRMVPGAASPDRTAPMPPAGPGPRPGGSAAWSGRARVPPPAPPMRDGVPAEWRPVDEPPGRAWWLPILIGVVALLLLAVLAYGLWLIASARDEEAPVVPSPSPSVIAPTPTAQTPTSAAPTTASPSPSPTTAESVPVPRVANLPLPVAQRILERLDLRYTVEYRESDRPAGTVLESNPQQGVQVAPGSEVRLIVAEPPAESPPVPTATPTAGPTPTG